jgi:hypothetical protein
MLLEGKNLRKWLGRRRIIKGLLAEQQYGPQTTVHEMIA